MRLSLSLSLSLSLARALSLSLSLALSLSLTLSLSHPLPLYASFSSLSHVHELDHAYDRGTRASALLTCTDTVLKRCATIIFSASKCWKLARNSRDFLYFSADCCFAPLFAQLRRFGRHWRLPSCCRQSRCFALHHGLAQGALTAPAAPASVAADGCGDPWGKTRYPIKHASGYNKTKKHSPPDWVLRPCISLRLP